MPHPLPHRLCHPLDQNISPPLNPGATPVIPAGATGPGAASIRYDHYAATLAFNAFVNVDCTLRQQLLGDVDNTFLQVLHKPHHRYSGSIPLDLLTHLYTMYAVISNADWLDNNKRFREPYSPSVPIEVAWQQIDDAVAYANAGSTPYSSKQVADNAYQLVFNTVIFAADCWEWNLADSEQQDATRPQDLFSSRAKGVAPLAAKQDRNSLRWCAQRNRTPRRRVPTARDGGRDREPGGIHGQRLCHHCPTNGHGGKAHDRACHCEHQARCKIISSMSQPGQQWRTKPGTRTRSQRQRRRHHTNPWSANRHRYSHQNRKTRPGAAHPLLLDMRPRMKAQ